MARSDPETSDAGTGLQVDRRTVMIGSAAVVAGATLGSRLTLAQDATPATPATEAPSIDALRAVSLALTGSTSVADAGLETLAGLVGSNSAFAELAAVPEMTADALNRLSPDAQTLATNILQFWYVGNWDGKPVANRADLYFSLTAWSALPYSTQPTLCKSFGYWAENV